jgi:hypothetical protein
LVIIQFYAMSLRMTQRGVAGQNYLSCIYKRSLYLTAFSADYDKSVMTWNACVRRRWWPHYIYHHIIFFDWLERAELTSAKYMSTRRFESGTSQLCHKRHGFNLDVWYKTWRLTESRAVAYLCCYVEFNKTFSESKMHLHLPKFADSNPAEAAGFFGRKNPQHAFLRRGSKAVCPMS